MDDRSDVTGIKELLAKRIFSEHGDSNESTYIPYGTAGFRAHAEELKPLLERIGACAVAKCFVTDSDLGIMVTASHNPIDDNGVKIIESDGEMLAPQWEPIFETVANAHNRPADSKLKESLITKIVDQYLSFSRDCKAPRTRRRIYLGCDTRPSSGQCVESIKHGLDRFGLDWLQVDHLDFGVITTPALHYLVAESRYFSASSARSSDSLSVKDYYSMLIGGFNSLDENTCEQQNYDPACLIVDCANGVGRLTMQHLLASDEFRRNLPAQLINISSEPDDVLNHECGADFVKTKHLAPRGANQLNKRYASLDGDADRVVYFFLDESETAGPPPVHQLKLIDGDKILVLFVKFLTEVLERYQLMGKLSLGAIQTAYANGASTDYLENHIKLKSVDCVDTGVKNLHKRACDYDLAVYFEANGHGTILVSKKARNLIDKHQVSELQNILGILNNYTGDAVSDILIAETILRHYDWGTKHWFEMYQDRPNSLIKVEIDDRSVIKTADAGRRCLNPKGLQDQIDKLVSEHGPDSRCFVRASGTENVVRIYAEARDKETAERLSRLVGQRVIDSCSNV